MLIFIDESGQDHADMPCEVLAGVAIAEDNLWTLVKAIRSVEKEHFGDYLRNLRKTEVKARKLLKRKCFRLAGQDFKIDSDELPGLANQCLPKGLEAVRTGKPSGTTKRELTGYHRSVLGFVDKVLDVAAEHGVQVFASIVDAEAVDKE